MRRFIIITEHLPADEQDAVTVHLHRLSKKCWHWIPNVWMLVDDADVVEAFALRTAIKQRLSGGLDVYVFQIDRSSKMAFSGHGEEKAIDWILKNFYTPEDRVEITDMNGKVLIPAPPAPSGETELN